MNRARATDSYALARVILGKRSEEVIWLNC